GVDDRSDLRTRGLDRLFRLPAIFVVAGMRIAEHLREVRQHLLHHARIGRRGRLIIEIDRQTRLVAARVLHAGRLHAGLEIHTVPSPFNHRSGVSKSRRPDFNHAAGAAAVLVASRAASDRHAARHRSLSAASLCQPRLTRIADPASAGSIFMAASTCERPTLPDEQAEPALTAMPARSSAITWTSLASPVRAMQLVL